jgi:hypothetical protein
MDLVGFISTESGKDLIVSFAVVDPEDPTQIESLTLLRTPMYEGILPADERGVSVSFERYVADERDLLEEVRWNEEAAILELETQLRTYELDLRKVDKTSLSTMRKVLKKMNYDGRVQMFGV